MADQTYTGRRVEQCVVTGVDPVTHSAWFDNPPPDDLAAVLHVGDSLDIETKGTTITGWRHHGRWWMHKSDQQLDAEHAEFVAKMEQDRRDRLEANREDWERRTAALPDWIQARLRHFINRGGSTFATDGWGYELVICELAVLFEPPEFGDSDAVNGYCRHHGVSGNQHGMARALARAHHEGHSLAGTVSALSPITGDVDYSQRGEDG